jgi:hypothetical protein
MPFIPTPTTGLGVAAAVALSGTGVLQTRTPVANTRGVAQYTVSVPIGGSVVVTSSAIDDAGALVGTPVSKLGASGKYAILAAAGITNTGLTVITGGNVGSYPTTTITPGTPAWTLTSPAAIDNTDAAAALADALAVYNALLALPTTAALTTGDIGVSGAQGSVGAANGTWYAGKYVSPSSIAMTTPITLDAQGNPNAVFVFYATASTITQALASTVTLANGALAQNVYWLAGSSFTSVTGTGTMVGNIMANTSITLGGGTLNGRALAGIVTSSGAVTISAAEAITVPQTSSQAGWNAIVLNNVPSANPAWFRPSNSGANANVGATSYDNTYFAPVSVDDTDSNPWTVRGRSAGQCVVEFQIPTFLNTEGTIFGPDGATVMDETPIDSISAELIVTVTGGTS